MHRHPVRHVLLLALGAVLAVAACDASTESVSTSGGSAGETPATTAAPTGTSGPGPGLTPVPGGQTVEPEPVPTRTGTMQTEWGEILVALPATFPMFPGAGIVDLPEVASATFSAPADLATATDWFAEALAARGYQLELSDPLEDGSQVMDVASDLPECRIRMTFRPEQDSTIITVLYGAGCAGLGG